MNRCKVRLASIFTHVILNKTVNRITTDLRLTIWYVDKTHLIKAFKASEVSYSKIVLIYFFFRC